MEQESFAREETEMGRWIMAMATMSAAAGCSEGARVERVESSLGVPSMLDFGRVPAGVPVERELVAVNSGGTALRLTLGLEPLNSGFSIDAADSRVLGPGLSRVVRVRFVSTSSGSRSAELAFGAVGKILGASQLRAEVVPGVEVAPRRLDFGTLLLGSTAEARVEVRNPSDYPIDVEPAPRVRAGDANSFLLPEPLASPTPFRIEPNTSAPFAIRFSPTNSSELHEVELILRSCSTEADAVCRASLELAGAARRAALECAPPSMDLGWLAVGTGTVTRVRCRNVSRSEVELVDVRVDAPGVDGLSALVVEGAPRALVPGEFAELEVAFTGGSQADDLEATVRVGHRSPELGSLPDVVLLWSARVGPPRIQVAPPRLDLGMVAERTRFEAKVVVSNVGLRALSIDGAETSSGELRVEDVPVRLDPGEAGVLRLAWLPTGTGDREISVRISSDDPARPEVIVPIVSQVVAGGRCSYRLTPARLDFGHVPAFHRHTRRIRFENTGPTQCLVRPLDSGSTVFGWALAGESLRVEPGQAIDLDVDFRPEDVGAARLELPIYVDAFRPAAPIVVAGEGRGGRSFAHPSLLDFGPVSPSCATSTAGLTVYNPGEAPLTVNRVAVYGDSRFQVQDSFLPRTVPPHGKISFVVGFDPRAAGPEEAAAGYAVELEDGTFLDGELRARIEEGVVRATVRGARASRLDILLVGLPPLEGDRGALGFDLWIREIAEMGEALHAGGIDVRFMAVGTVGLSRGEFPPRCPLEDGPRRPANVMNGDCGFLVQIPIDPTDPESATTAFVGPGRHAPVDGFRAALTRLMYGDGTRIGSADGRIAAEKALSFPWAAGDNEGVYREEAGFLYLDLTTGRRHYGNSDDAYPDRFFYARHLDAVFGRLAPEWVAATAVGGTPAVGTTSFILHSQPCYGGLWSYFDIYSRAYVPFLIGGSVVEWHCTPGWGRWLAQFNTPIQGRRLVYRLPYAPDPDSVRVFVNGSERTRGSDWGLGRRRSIAYRDQKGGLVPAGVDLPNTLIEFRPTAMPEQNDRIEVEYVPQCSQRF